MRERPVVVSYGYLTRAMAEPKSKMVNDGVPAYINYSTFEEQFLKQTQGSYSKRSWRHRSSKSHRYSDIESDTGSDGVAVNSSGSGRSGDWAPPRRRAKPRAKKRYDSSSLTDSGISLSKDTASLSGSSCHRFEDDSIPRNGVMHTQDQCSYDRTASTPSKVKSNTQKYSIRRSNSCSALPSNVKVLDRHNPRLSSKDVTVDNTGRKISSEEQENAILQQCYKNEEEFRSTTEYSNDAGRSYVFDCSKPLGQSKFPLPDHLNYPLCKYRHKSELILNRSPLKPLKKLKDGWKKLKAKRLSNQNVNEEAVNISTISSNISFLEYLSEDEDDNEKILARLSSNPTQKKSLLKKLFKKVGSKSYSAQDAPSTVSELDSSPTKSMFQRAASTRSIPDALKDMWNKVHDVEFNETPPLTTMSRAKSMPSISAHPNTRTELPDGDIIYFNEAGFMRQQEEYNYFNNFFKPINSPTKTNQSGFKPKLSGGNDVITGVLGQSNKQTEIKQTLLDATLTSVTDKISDKENKENISLIQNSPIVVENIQNNSDSFRPNTYYCETNHDQNQRRISHHSMYASSLDISPSNKSFFYNPKAVYSTHSPLLTQNAPPLIPQQINYERCSCCMQQYPPQYEYPYYPQPNFVYEVQPRYSQTLQHGNSNNRDSIVVAPLDVQMSCERKAERRKISDMVFDTFV